MPIVTVLHVCQISMGLDSDTTAGRGAGTTTYGFVDVYGSAFGRDVEPSEVRAVLHSILHEQA